MGKSRRDARINLLFLFVEIILIINYRACLKNGISWNLMEINGFIGFFSKFLRIACKPDSVNTLYWRPFILTHCHQ